MNKHYSLISIIPVVAAIVAIVASLSAGLVWVADRGRVEAEEISERDQKVFCEKLDYIKSEVTSLSVQIQEVKKEVKDSTVRLTRIETKIENKQ